jgi:hypothetical protein
VTLNAAGALDVENSPALQAGVVGLQLEVPIHQLDIQDAPDAGGVLDDLVDLLAVMGGHGVFEAGDHDVAHVDCPVLHLVADQRLLAEVLQQREPAESEQQRQGNAEGDAEA